MMEDQRLLVICTLPESLVLFRRELLSRCIAENITVYAAAPVNEEYHRVATSLNEIGVCLKSIPFTRTRISVFSDLIVTIKLYGLMRQIAPTHVVAYTPKAVVYGSLAARLAGVGKRAALITGAGSTFIRAASWKLRMAGIALRWMYAVSLRCCNVVFFQNPDDKMLFTIQKLISADITAVVLPGSGVNLRQFRPSPLSRSPKFLCIARLLRSKGIIEYLEAAQTVKAMFPAASFSLVGWLDDHPDVIPEETLKQYIESGTLNFLGKLNDVRSAISDSNIYVLPSYREGLPRTVLEAMAMGRPVITTDVAGCRDTVDHGVNGFLCRARDKDSLVSAMIKFINEPELIYQMGRQSRLKAEQQFDVDLVNRMMMSAIFDA